jgi:hypothetical protein
VAEAAEAVLDLGPALEAEEAGREDQALAPVRAGAEVRIAAGACGMPGEPRAAGVAEAMAEEAEQEQEVVDQAEVEEGEEPAAGRDLVAVEGQEPAQAPVAARALAVGLDLVDPEVEVRAGAQDLEVVEGEEPALAPVVAAVPASAGEVEQEQEAVGQAEVAAKNLENG